MDVTVTIHKNKFALKFPFDQILLEKAKGIPERRFNPKLKAWLFSPTKENVTYVKKWMPQALWSNETAPILEDITARQKAREEVMLMKTSNTFTMSDLDNTPFAMKPYIHQGKALLLGRDCTAFAYLMDQGTGKTKVTIDDFSYNCRKGRINALLVIVDNSIKTNWVNPDGSWDMKNEITGELEPSDELSKHLPPDFPRDHVNKGCWISSPLAPQRKIFQKFRDQWGGNSLHVMVVNVEGLSHKRVFEVCEEFVSIHNCMVTIDESTSIKNRSSKRTKNCYKLGNLSVMRRIMSGTPVIKSPLHSYAQFKFLDIDILGYNSYYTFRNHYAIMGGFEQRQVLMYKNLEELSDSISSSSYRVLLDDCTDMPPKIYTKREVYMTDDQARIYAEMAKNMVTTIGAGDAVSAPIILSQILRLQQITGGYLPRYDPETGEEIEVRAIVPPERNPKLCDLLRVLEEVGDNKMVIWCHFRPELEGAAQLLRKQGIKFVEFHGGVSEMDRLANRKTFKNDPSVQVVLANQAAGGKGIDEFKVAKYSVIISNSFNTEHRAQLEARTRRIGSEHHDSINYIDIVMADTVDVKIIKTLRANMEISRQVMKDGYQEWI